MEREPDYADYEDDDEYDPEDDFDCHMGPDGQCGAAGSEMCDWECPVMAAIHREEIARRQKVRDRRRGSKKQGKLPGVT